MLIGYMRVSTIDQSLDLQRDGLEKAGCEKIYDDFNNNVRRAVRQDGRTESDTTADARRVDEVTAAFSNASEY